MADGNCRDVAHGTGGPIIEGVPEAVSPAVLVVDSELKVVHATCGDHWRNRLSPQQVVGMDLQEVIPEAIDDAYDCREAVLSVLDSRSPITWSAQHSETLSGWKQVYDIHITPSVGPAGKPTAIMVFADVTRQRRHAYERMVLHQVARALLQQLQLPELLHAILTTVTAGGAIGLGFNRAILLMVDDDNNMLAGEMGVGPANIHEAAEIWQEVSGDYKTIEDFLADYRTLQTEEATELQPLVDAMKFDLNNSEKLPILSVVQRRPAHVTDPTGDDRVPQKLHDLLQADEFVVTPMVTSDSVIGAIIADNKFTDQHISRSSVQFLTVLANLAALAIDRAERYQQTRRQAQQLDEALEELKTAQKERLRNARLAAVGEIAAIVAHEIRGPLSAIGGLAERIAHAPDDTGRAEKNANLIFDESQRLEQILDQLLDFSKPSTPKLDAVAAEELIGRVANSARHDPDAQGVEIIQRVDENLPQIIADEKQIEQVLLNLIGNAFAAIEGDSGRITIGATRHEQMVQIYVTDNGQGIANKHLDKIFDAFYSTKPDGTGLGLAICNRIITQHDGELSVETDRGEGTKFTINLPACNGADDE